MKFLGISCVFVGLAIAAVNTLGSYDSLQAGAWALMLFCVGASLLIAASENTR